MIHKTSIIKVKKAIKLLDADIQMIATRIKSKQHKNESITKHQPLRVVENEVYEFISNNPEYKQNSASLLISNRKCFHIFAENIELITHLYEVEHKSSEYIAKWLRISHINFLFWVKKYYNSLHKTQIKLESWTWVERLNLIKGFILEFIDSNKGKWIIVNQIVDFINTVKLADQILPNTTYREVYLWLKIHMNYSWRKASQRAPRWFKNGLEESRIIFKEFLFKLKKAGFIVVFIDESTFNCSSLPRYTWMKKGMPADRVIRTTSDSYNIILAQWNKEVFVKIKNTMTNEEEFNEFIKEVDKELKFRISKNTYNKRLIIMFDNAKFHKKDRIVKTVKLLNWIVFTFPPYSPELNEAEHTFGVIKSKL